MLGVYIYMCMYIYIKGSSWYGSSLSKGRAYVCICIIYMGFVYLVLLLCIYKIHVCGNIQRVFQVKEAKAGDL